ncbi:MAG: hypothetical protein ABII01_02195 [Candidatus Woesearchaeota archaeon]
MDAETAKKVNEMASSLRQRGVCTTMEEAVERAKKILLKSDEIVTPDIDLDTSMSVNEASGIMKGKINDKRPGKKHPIDDEELDDGWVHDDEYHKTGNEEMAENKVEEQPEHEESEEEQKPEQGIEEEQPDDDTEDDIEPEEKQTEKEHAPEEPEPDIDDDAQKEVFTNIPEDQQQKIGFEDDDSNADVDDESLEDSELKELDFEVKDTNNKPEYDDNDSESTDILSDIDKEIEEEQPEGDDINHGYTNDEDIIVKTLSEIFEEEQENEDEENPEKPEEE